MKLRVPRIHDRRPLAGAVLTLWIAISPWVWGFANDHSAVANHVALVFGFGPLALLIANLRPAAIVTLLGGMWLAISPWLLSYATDHAAWANELVTGLLLVVLCASAAGLRVPRRGRARRAEMSAAPPLAETAGSRS
jgi:SPW repeat